MSRIQRHPSWVLCRKLSGGESDGNVGDLADLIAQYLENSEVDPADRAPDPPTLAEARAAVAHIRKVLDAVELRLAGDR
jgi:hypothetical protein